VSWHSGHDAECRSPVTIHEYGKAACVAVLRFWRSASRDNSAD
jgi:hypothetical protein